MISKHMNTLLNKQVNDEIASAYLYLAMSLNADTKGLKGTANWFYVQAQEEMLHSRILQRYMLAQNVHITLENIEAIKITWNNPMDLFKDALEHEMGITSSINMIAREAQKENDYATLSCMQWFVDEQVEEEEHCNELVHKFRQAIENPFMLYNLDRDLGRRKYHIPCHARAEQWFT